METQYNGIDYGFGRTNVDTNGVRYGVINQSEVGQAWYDESEPEYGEILCGECFAEVAEDQTDCPECGADLINQFDFIEPINFYFIDNGYRIFQSQDDTDLFIEKSPFFTYAQFCSPCAPGAVYLINPIDEKDNNNKGYCLGHDWFEDGIAPYPVYSIETGKLVKPKG
jgi:hypothetical protein